MFSPDSSFVVLYSTDIARTRGFFEKLGVIPTEFTDEKCVVSIGSLELHYILNTSEPFEAYKYIARPGGFGQGAVFYIETTDIDALPQLVVQAGGTLKSEIFENQWECRELLVEDPEGFKFAFYESAKTLQH